MKLLLRCSDLNFKSVFKPADKYLLLSSPAIFFLLYWTKPGLKLNIKSLTVEVHILNCFLSLGSRPNLVQKNEISVAVHTCCKLCQNCMSDVIDFYFDMVSNTQWFLCVCHCVHNCLRQPTRIILFGPQWKLYRPSELPDWMCYTGCFTLIHLINYQVWYTIKILGVLKPLCVYSVTLELLSGWPLTSMPCLRPNCINEGIRAQDLWCIS